MTNLTKHETVWLQAYCASIPSELVYTGAATKIELAEQALIDFQNRFPPSPPPQKETYESQFVSSPQPSKDRREFWIDMGSVTKTFESYVYKAYEKQPQWPHSVRVVELRPGEVIVTREMLAKAWDECQFTDRNRFANIFDDFCKALGLGHE